MFGYIVKPDLLQDVEESFPNEHTLFERVGEFTAEEFISHCQAAAPLTLNTFVIDADCSNEEAIIKGIRRFRMNNNARIIMLAPGREPGDRMISQLVGIGVWDIVAPSAPIEDENLYLTPYINQQLEMKYSYGNASRWHNIYEDETPSIPEQKVKKKEKQTQTISEVIYKDRIVGSVTIAIGSTGPRTGCTHTAIQSALFLKEQGFEVACVELIDPNVGRDAFHTFKTNDGSLKQTGGFSAYGIDFFPQANIEAYLQIISAQYQYVVIDVGRIVQHKTEDYNLSIFGNEFVRADVQMITATPAIWDVQNIVLTLDAFYKWKWDLSWNVIVNLADDKAFKEIEHMFSKKEKEKLRLRFHQNQFQTDPFHITKSHRETFEVLFESVIPESRKKRKLLFF